MASSSGVSLPQITPETTILSLKQQAQAEQAVVQLVSQATDNVAKAEVNAGLTGQKPANVAVAPGTYLDIEA